MTDDPLVGVRDGAKQANVHPRTLQRWIEQEWIKPVRVEPRGKKMQRPLYRLSDIEQLRDDRLKTERPQVG